jgi:hypothetical protein
MNDKYFYVIEAPQEVVKANFPGLNKTLYEIAGPGTYAGGMSLESVADELCISGTLHSRQVKVVEMLEEIEPSAFCHTYVSHNGPAHILIDAYFAKKEKCQEFADKLNQRYDRMMARRNKKKEDN